MAHQASLSSCPLTQGDKTAGDAAKTLHGLVQKLSNAVINDVAQNPVHAMLILAQAANGLLHLLARISMRNGDDDIPIPSTATLFAAMTAYHTAPCEVEKGRVQAEFSPLVLFDALKDMEKLTGQQPDEQLNEVMCRVARECAADPAVIAQIQRERASVFTRSSPTLN